MTTPKRANTHAYRKWVQAVKANCEPTCYRCGYPIDMSLPSTHPDGPSAEHIHPLAEGGDLTPSLEDSALSHLHCNRSHGGRIGSQRSQTNKTTNNRSLKAQQSSPAAPALITPKGAGKAGEQAIEPRTHPDGFVYPRLETGRPRTVVGSYGGQAQTWLSEVYGLELRGWQAYALDRALEHDEDGNLIWATVIITVGRQSGKSVLSRALCMWRMHHADLFGEPQTILHVANKRSTAMEVMRPAGLWAAEKYGKQAVKWGNERAGIELPSGDRWLIHAANDSAGVGFSISMAFCDEAWKIRREVVDDAINPTMAERNMPQLYLVSTAGDSSSDLMMAYRQRALDRIEDKDPGAVLLLEWSAPAEADPAEVSTWRWASPEWTPKREQFLRQQWQNVEESAWRREYLNQWVVRSNHWLKDSVWNGTLDVDAQLPVDGVWTVAVESDFDGMGHAVAIAGLNDQGQYVVRATTHRTIKEVDERLRQIRAEHASLYVLVTPTYAERLRERFDSLVGQREAVTATKILLDLFDQGLIRHDGSQILQEHFGSTTISKRQGGWVMSAPMGHGGVYAARAVMFAVAEAAKNPKPVPVIHTRRRA